MFLPVNHNVFTYHKDGGIFLACLKNIRYKGGAAFGRAITKEMPRPSAAPPLLWFPFLVAMNRIEFVAVNTIFVLRLSKTGRTVGRTDSRMDGSSVGRTHLKHTTPTLGTYLEYIWNVFGSYLEHIWNVFGTYLERIWNLFGTYLKRIWNVFAMYLECIWNVFGTYLQRIWNLERIWNVIGRYLKHIWNVFAKTDRFIFIF